MLSKISKLEAFKILCLYLAQNREPNEPHLDLGFQTQQMAFEAIAQKFGKKPNTVKNERDAFDALTNSDRRGWQRELRPALKLIWDQFSKLPRNELLTLSKEILNTNWDNIASSELPDLQEIISECQDRLSRFNILNPVNIDQKLWMDIQKAYLENYTTRNDKVSIVGGHTFCITTPDDKFLAISAQEFPRFWAVMPYISPLKKYEKIVNELVSFLGYNSRGSQNAVKEVFGKLPSNEWRTSSDPSKRIDQEKIQQIDKFISARFQDDLISIERFKRFLEDKDWSGVSKQLSRNDWIDAAITSAGGWLAVAAARRGEMAQALLLYPNIDSDLENIIDKSTENEISFAPSSKTRLTGGKNILYYGAPGTGKSFTAKNESEEKNAYVVRTLFHPDMQNSDFLGTLKPAVGLDGAPTYKFRPGPFAKALRHARDNPAERVHLVIEELNRAMAPAVFGDLFQLLDRDEDGSSEYEVDTPSDEFAEWYGEIVLKLPSNLWIYATMNSADQGVYPLDTAFRRRWHQIYIPIDYNIAPADNVRVSITGKPDVTIPWSIFVKKLNAFLTDTKEINTPEDRLIGPRFLREFELAEGILPGKLLIYLWDDLLRHHGRDTLFLDKIKTYGELNQANKDGKQIFNPVFLDNLLLNQPAPLAS